MIRSALLLCAAMLTALCFACVQAPPPPLSVRAAALSFNAPVPCPTISNVRELSASVPATANMDPDPNGNATAAPSNMQTDLVSAWAAAPPSFQAQLCALNKIFVTQGPESWGYRNITDGGRYIAISESLWNSAGAIPLNQYENRVFGFPLCWMGAPVAPCLPTMPQANDPTAPIYSVATPNNGTMTLIAALAHEFGHVLWSDRLVYPRGTPPVSGRFCNKVLNEAWNEPLQIPIWRGFEDTAYTDPADIPDDDPSDPPLATDPGKKQAKVLKMLDALNAPNFDHAHRILRRILAKPRPFPSLLGAYSANEQFVETFTLATLLRAGLTSLPLQITPGETIDIASDIVTSPSSRRRLRKVLSCF